MALESQKAASKLVDEGGEAVERMTSLWNQYGRTALGVLGVVAVLAVGAYFYQRNRTTQENAAAGRLAEANVLYWQGDYARSTELAKQVATQYPGTTSGSESHRLQGDNAFWQGEFKNAVAEYRRYLDKAPDNVLTDAVRRSYAYALESDNQYAEGAKVYDSLVGKFDRVSSAEFLSAAARCFRALGQPAEAIKRLQRVDTEFGETTYARTARVLIAELQASIAK